MIDRITMMCDFCGAICMPMKNGACLCHDCRDALASAVAGASMIDPRVIERHVARRNGHRRACACIHCAGARVRLKRAARIRGLLQMGGQVNVHARDDRHRQRRG